MLKIKNKNGGETSLKAREGRFYLMIGEKERTVCSLKVELCDWAMQGCKGGPSIQVPGTCTARSIYRETQVQGTYPSDY